MQHAFHVPFRSRFIRLHPQLLSNGWAALLQHLDHFLPLNSVHTSFFFAVRFFSHIHSTSAWQQDH